MKTPFRRAMQSAIPCFLCLSWLISKSMKISVLGIGTELTTGQILNQNGTWISQRFKALGIPTSLHLVVPDEIGPILKALHFCAENSDLLFVTGGLGPTSDDMTRSLISQWTGRKLLWDEASWKHIEARLSSRGIPVNESQKQQCYFPEGSKVLFNHKGTANAFHMAHLGKEIFVLPGPPLEVESIWNDHLAQSMKEKAKAHDALIIRSWETIGMGESQVADLTEAALKGCPFEKGYRVHAPYVEVKLTYPQSRSLEAEKWVQKINDSLAGVIVLRDEEQVAEKLAHKLEAYEKILICDEIPGSFLLQKLFPFLKNLLMQKKFHFQTTLPSRLDPNTLYLHLREDGVNRGCAELHRKGQSQSQVFLSPYQSVELKEREKQFYSEMAQIFWLKELQS